MMMEQPQYPPGVMAAAQHGWTQQQMYQYQMYMNQMWLQQQQEQLQQQQQHAPVQYAPVAAEAASSSSGQVFAEAPPAFQQPQAELPSSAGPPGSWFNPRRVRRIATSNSRNQMVSERACTKELMCVGCGQVLALNGDNYKRHLRHCSPMNYDRLFGEFDKTGAAVNHTAIMQRNKELSEELGLCNIKLQQLHQQRVEVLTKSLKDQDEAEANCVLTSCTREAGRAMGGDYVAASLEQCRSRLLRNQAWASVLFDEDSSSVVHPRQATHVRVEPLSWKPLLSQTERLGTREAETAIKVAGDVACRTFQQKRDNWRARMQELEACKTAQALEEINQRSKKQKTGHASSSSSSSSCATTTSTKTIDRHSAVKAEPA
eukprot:TRINITY_DN68134_c4_g7_i1.p1 TRINITY_DN68134_c4_g7~~TRINITY_DN68134_c4_g7_i1.p1  ORF type:complete len:374 (+),score=44.12 TRINITY_DN68134_c4_g7_i1:16-1137(+)